jgi:hypothetical protein
MSWLVHIIPIDHTVLSYPAQFDFVPDPGVQWHLLFSTLMVPVNDTLSLFNPPIYSVHLPRFGLSPSSISIAPSLLVLS